MAKAGEERESRLIRFLLNGMEDLSARQDETDELITLLF